MGYNEDFVVRSARPMGVKDSDNKIRVFFKYKVFNIKLSESFMNNSG
jgi:hypothetical protein